jgi:SAM-dependent methyltransferase
MHTEAYLYVQGEAQKLILTPKTRILEIGSLDVNGSIRPLFQPCGQYVGIDVRDGRGVDEVVEAADFDGGGTFDIVVSCKTLEHAAEPRDIIGCAWRALKAGGTFIITAVGNGRPAHNCDGSPHNGIEPYENITRARLKALLKDWDDVSIHEANGPKDIYATATKPKE